MVLRNLSCSFPKNRHKAALQCSLFYRSWWCGSIFRHYDIKMNQRSFRHFGSHAKKYGPVPKQIKIKHIKSFWIQRITQQFRILKCRCTSNTNLLDFILSIRNFLSLVVTQKFIYIFVIVIRQLWMWAVLLLDFKSLLQNDHQPSNHVRAPTNQSSDVWAWINIAILCHHESFHDTVNHNGLSV